MRPILKLNRAVTLNFGQRTSVVCFRLKAYVRIVSAQILGVLAHGISPRSLVIQVLFGGSGHHYFISVFVNHWHFSMQRLLAYTNWLNFKTILDMLKFQLFFDTDLRPIHLSDILGIVVNLLPLFLCFLFVLYHVLLFFIYFVNFVLIMIRLIRQFLVMLFLFSYWVGSLFLNDYVFFYLSILVTF